MPRNLSALGNMAAWVTSLVAGIKPRAEIIGKWIDGWNEAGEIEGEFEPHEGSIKFKIKLPSRGEK